MQNLDNLGGLELLKIVFFLFLFLTQKETIFLCFCKVSLERLQEARFYQCALFDIWQLIYIKINCFVSN